jgi:hypothetical protein
MDLIQIQPTGKTPIKQCTPVFIITREGKSYNAEGIQFVKEGIEEHFDIHSDLAIYSGIALNNTKVLAKFVEENPNGYIVLATKDSVVYIPQHHNQDICYDLRANPDETSWELLMKICRLELY